MDGCVHILRSATAGLAGSARCSRKFLTKCERERERGTGSWCFNKSCLLSHVSTATTMEAAGEGCWARGGDDEHRWVGAKSASAREGGRLVGCGMGRGGGRSFHECLGRRVLDVGGPRVCHYKLTGNKSQKAAFSGFTLL